MVDCIPQAIHHQLNRNQTCSVSRVDLVTQSFLMRTHNRRYVQAGICPRALSCACSAMDNTGLCLQSIRTVMTIMTYLVDGPIVPVAVTRYM